MTLDEALAEIEAHQAAREQQPTAVTTIECRRLIAAIKYALEIVYRYDDLNDDKKHADKIASILAGGAA